MSLEVVKIAVDSYDSYTKGIKQIDTDHYYIHAGKKFKYSENFSLATTATKVISFTTPDTKTIHYRPDIISCSADKLRIQLFEGDTVTGGTNKLTSIFNQNRGSSATTTMTLFSTGTTQSVQGTDILSLYIGGGTNVGGTSAGNNISQAEEIVLKTETTYSLLFTNNSSNTNVVNVVIAWYEEALLN